MYYQLDLTEKQAKVLRPLSENEKKERITAEYQAHEELTEVPIGGLLKCGEFVLFIYFICFFMQMYGFIDQ